VDKRIYILLIVYCLSPCIKPIFYGEFRQVAKLEESN